MRKAFYFLTFATALMLASCEKNKVTPEPEIRLTSTEQIPVSVDGGTAAIGYEIINPFEGGELTAASSADWISGFSYGTDQVTFTVAPNTETTERNATITLTYLYDGGKTVEAVAGLVQEAFIPAPEISVDKQTLNVGPEGGENEVAITITNPTEDGDIDASVEANWVTITSVNATAITFTVDENPDTDERSTAITVTYTYDGGKTIDARIEITQEARIPDPEMTISEPEVHVSADGGESEVAVVITNPAQDGSINATTDASWITITSVNETSVAFTTSENTETSERNATITVTYTYGGGKTIDAGITVTQEATQSSSQYDYDYILVAYSGYKAGSNFYATFADKEYTSLGEPNTTYYKLDLYSDNSTNSDLTAGTYTLSESTGAPMTFSKKYSNGASYNEYRDYAWNVKFAEGTINISYEGDNMIMEGFMTDESGKTHHILYNGVKPQW